MNQPAPHSFLPNFAELSEDLLSLSEKHSVTLDCLSSHAKSLESCFRALPLGYFEQGKQHQSSLEVSPFSATKRSSAVESEELSLDLPKQAGETTPQEAS